MAPKPASRRQRAPVPPPIHRRRAVSGPVIAVPTPRRSILRTRDLDYGAAANPMPPDRDDHWRWTMVDDEQDREKPPRSPAEGPADDGPAPGAGPVAAERRGRSGPSDDLPYHDPGIRAAVRRARRSMAGGATATMLAIVIAMVTALVAVMVVVPAAGTTAGLGRLGASTTAPGPQTLGDGERAALIALANDAVFRVAGVDCEGTIVGSGFLVGEDVVTSAHLTTGTTTVAVDRPGVRSPATEEVRAVTARLLGADLALIDGAGAAAVGLEVADGVPAVDAPVVIAGHDGSGTVRATVAAVHLVVPGSAYGLDTTVLLLDPAIRPGYSGGPVLDRDGRVVGIVKGVDEATGLTVAVAADALLALQLDATTIANEQPQESGCN
ncbi:MAG: serine protease [Actinomycetota bacterium]